jgi:hypothetical protein
MLINKEMENPKWRINVQFAISLFPFLYFRLRTLNWQTVHNEQFIVQ